MDTETLARIQFALTISFHYIYPPLSIGLGLIMVILESIYVRTGKTEYHTLARFWTRIFAITYGIGVATGVVMEFEFGTNWATYSNYVGDVFGSALAAEGIFAFALESGFLGILVFGWDKVKPIIHLIATIGVFLGSMFSAIWIVVANSWQQTPAGYQIIGEGLRARAEITDFWEMVFNPSSVDRIIHVWIGAFLAGAFLVLSVHAYYILKNRYVEISKKAFKIALVVATVFSLSQLASGSKEAKIVGNYQPAKLAAMEGHWDSLSTANMYIMGWVNKKNETTKGLYIPNGLSYLMYDNFKTPVKGLEYFEPKNRPGQPNAVFQFYHLMIIIGVMLIALSLLGIIEWRRKKLFNQKWLLWIFVVAIILPEIANQAGWFTAEMGRQPWVVYNLLRTSDALSQSVKANQILTSIIMFTILYILLFILFIFLINRTIQKGIVEEDLHLNNSLRNDIVDVITQKQEN